MSSSSSSSPKKFSTLGASRVSTSRPGIKKGKEQRNTTWLFVAGAGLDASNFFVRIGIFLSGSFALNLYYCVRRPLSIPTPVPASQLCGSSSHFLELVRCLL